MTSTEPTLSAYMQCFSNKRAVYETLRSFRAFYPTASVTLVSDRGEDFTRFAEHFRLRYYRSEQQCDPRGQLGEAGVIEYLRRVYDHCITCEADFVVILEEDVTTRRRIRCFPATTCAGPRLNAFSEPLNRYLQALQNTTRDFGYAMCGGSVFDRRAFVECYERGPVDWRHLGTLDPGVLQYSDLPLTLIFLVNGYTFSVWEEVSEEHHPIAELRIFRDAAFDHNDKRWYGLEFDEALLG